MTDSINPEDKIEIAYSQYTFRRKSCSRLFTSKVILLVLCRDLIPKLAFMVAGIRLMQLLKRGVLHFSSGLSAYMGMI